MAPGAQGPELGVLRVVYFNSRAASANAGGAVAPTMLGGLGLGVAFDLTDPALEQVLRNQVAHRADLFEADTGDAAVTITDRPASLGGAVETHRVLRIGADEARRNAIDSLDPVLILAAATLIAAGYTLERDVAEARPSSKAFPALSQRERQVAELLVDGASNKVIARALDISVHTAKFHVTAILEKLGARNRADAVSIILRERLMPT